MEAVSIEKVSRRNRFCLANERDPVLWYFKQHGFEIERCQLIEGEIAIVDKEALEYLKISRLCHLSVPKADYEVVEQAHQAYSRSCHRLNSGYTNWTFGTIDVVVGKIITLCRGQEQFSLKFAKQNTVRMELNDEFSLIAFLPILELIQQTRSRKLSVLIVPGSDFTRKAAQYFSYVFLMLATDATFSQIAVMLKEKFKNWSPILVHGEIDSIKQKMKGEVTDLRKRLDMMPQYDITLWVKQMSEAISKQNHDDQAPTPSKK